MIASTIVNLSKLFDISRFLPARHSLHSRIVKQKHILRTTYHSEEIICIHRVLIFKRRQAICRANTVGNKRFRIMFCRKHLLVHRQDYDIFKIQRPRLQHAHYLQSVQRFSFKWHNCPRHCARQ